LFYASERFKCALAEKLFGKIRKDFRKEKEFQASGVGEKVKRFWLTARAI
jgi:hypothetical protein